jgi:hypothetical protein
VASLSPFGVEAERKRVRIGRLVARAEPEAVVIYPWPG